MKIQIPHWLTDVKDEHLIVFLWFCHRMSKQYGFNTYYTLEVDDVVRTCNKRNKGLFEWLLERTSHIKDITFGVPYDNSITFLVRRKDQVRVGRPAAEDMYEIELTNQRAQFTYVYLLGCLNNNLVYDKTVNRHRTNTFGMKEFRITREAKQYVKKALQDLE